MEKISRERKKNIHRDDVMWGGMVHVLFNLIKYDIPVCQQHSIELLVYSHLLASRHSRVIPASHPLPALFHLCTCTLCSRWRSMLRRASPMSHRTENKHFWNVNEVIGRHTGISLNFISHYIVWVCDAAATVAILTGVEVNSFIYENIMARRITTHWFKAPIGNFFFLAKNLG